MREKLIILHGALGSIHQFENLIEKAKEYFEVYFYTFSGHAHKELINEFSIDSFAEELMVFIQENKLADAVIFGYSMGGYVALHAGQTKNISFKRLITLGTKFDWNYNSVEQEVKKLNPQQIEEKVPHFAKDLQRRHKDWKLLLERTSGLMRKLGDSPLLQSKSLSQLHFPIFICRGENDKMVSREESMQMVQHDHVRYIEIENTPHPIEKVETDKLIDLIRLI